MNPTRPVLRYHGGKWMLAPTIISHFPPHRVYVEPFGGAASVLMRKPRSFGEVYNDVWSDVVNVFRVLRDPEQSAELERLLRLTPFAREEYEADWPDDEALPLERARRSVLRSFAGFGSASTCGNYRTGFRSNSNRSHTTPAHDWARYPDQLRGFCERLKGVVIEHRAAVEVIEQHDSPEALFYVDPPYPHATRNMERGNAAYHHEMTDEQHEQLAVVLRGCRGMVALSGYRCDLYDRLYCDWDRREFNATSDGRTPRVEVLWLNQACADAQRQRQIPMGSPA